MTLDEAIKHAEEVMIENLEKTMNRNSSDPIAIQCYECAEEHRQLAEWLKDYKRLLERESCEDAISRKSIKQKLQEHHDFFINTYSGFSNLPQNDKSRVDEITNCIAMVVNEPTVTPQPKIGYWIEKDDNLYVCSECGQYIYSETEHDLLEFHAFCGRCGTKMIEPQESEVQDA